MLYPWHSLFLMLHPWHSWFQSNMGGMCSFMEQLELDTKCMPFGRIPKAGLLEAKEILIELAYVLKEESFLSPVMMRSSSWKTWTLHYQVCWWWPGSARSQVICLASVVVQQWLKLRHEWVTTSPENYTYNPCILLSTLLSVASDLFNYSLRLDNELSARPPRSRHGLWTGLKTQMGCLQIVWWS